MTRSRIMAFLAVGGLALSAMSLASGCGNPAPPAGSTATASESPSLTPIPDSPSPTPIPRSTGPLDLHPPDGYVYNGGGVTDATDTMVLGNDCTIVGVHFKGGGGDSGIKIKGSRNRVSGCTFDSFPWAGLVVLSGNDNVIYGNRFNGVTGFGACIQILGGKRNQITSNFTRGGITAIAFLYSRGANGGGAASLIEDNVVSRNTCSGFSQEGITFDVLGNSAMDTAALEYDTIASVDGSTVTLSSRKWPSYVGYDIVFLSGASAGRTRSIVGQSGNGFVLDPAPAGATRGDQVVIGAAFKGNLVSRNTVTAATSDLNSILLYGMAFGNRIEDNRVRSGSVKVESLDNLVIAAGSVTRTYGRAPSGYNTIRNNIVSGDISLEYYAIPDMNGHANGYAPYVSTGNNVIGNQCRQVNANQQVAFIADNTGTTDYSDVTLSGSEMH
jgi:Right handed beta helix region